MRRRDRGAVLVEFAIVAPILVLLIVGGLLMGAAMWDRLQLQHTVQQASYLEYEDQVAEAIERAGGTLDCYQVLTDPDDEPCFGDGFGDLPRVQIVADARTWTLPFFGRITPTVEVTRVLRASEQGEP